MPEKIASHLDTIERATASINGIAAYNIVQAVQAIRDVLDELTPAEQRLMEVDRAHNSITKGQFPDGTQLPRDPRPIWEDAD